MTWPIGDFSGSGDLIDLTFVPWNLAFPSRVDVFTLVDRFLFLTKLRMLRLCGWGVESLYAPDPRPWGSRTIPPGSRGR